MRVILHSDLNNFYASVETLKRPELKDVPLAVCGREEDRHGIILAKNQIAKEYGVKTGEVIWEAKAKCKNLVCVTACHEDYQIISEKVRAIYARFTDVIEPFGIDECWLDVTHSKNLGTGEEIAEKIRQTVKEEIGITVSVGVSFNKVFAKLGSDMKKPDAITVITPENFKEKVWKLPVGDMLYVGKATREKLSGIGIRTIGDVATSDVKVLKRLLGVWGQALYENANGLDQSPVCDKKTDEGAKSIGNSLTDYRDLYNFDDVKTLIVLLSESVASRLRESGLGKAKTVKISVVDNALKTYGKQGKLQLPSSSDIDIAECAFDLFKSFYTFDRPVRGVGVSVSDFTFGIEQISLVGTEKIDKSDRLDQAVDKIRKKYGNTSLRRATILQDKKLANTDVKGGHKINEKPKINIDED